MPASGVKQTTARFVGLSILSMILFGGTRSHVFAGVAQGTQHTAIT